MVFQAVVEPIFVGLKADEYPSRAPVPRNHDFRSNGETQVLREVILDPS